MKKFLLVVIAVIVSFGLKAQGIQFEHGTFAEALAKAKTEKKLVFMDCYTSWCGPCKMLARDIFPQKAVGDFFNQHFVNVKMDMESGEGVGLKEKYDVKAYPTLLFISPDGEVVHKLVGGMPAEELIEEAKVALVPELRTGALKQKYDGGNREHDFLITYLRALKKQYDQEGMTLVARELVKGSSLEQYMTMELFYVIAAARFPYESKEFKYLLENRDKVKDVAGVYEIRVVYDDVVYNYLKDYASKCESLEALRKEIEYCFAQIEQHNIEEVKKYLEYIYYLANDQLLTWYDVKMEEAANIDDDSRYASFMRALGEEVVRTPKLNSSKEVMSQVMELMHEFSEKEQGAIFGNLILTQLYQKQSDKRNAIKYFELFCSANEKAGGDNTHSKLIELKKDIDSL